MDRQREIVAQLCWRLWRPLAPSTEQSGQPAQRIGGFWWQSFLAAAGLPWSLSESRPTKSQIQIGQFGHS
jgi:hypothetical protein